MTLQYVNGHGTSDENLKKLLTNTGFFTNNSNDETRDFGKWFKLDYGELPTFLSRRTYQYSGEAIDTGWAYKKHHYPDMWIDPKDSFVLTINAGEIVSSSDFSAGVTLRFPRIAKIRAKEFDDGAKPPEEVESVMDLHDLFQQRLFQQQDAERESQSQSQYKFDYDGGAVENKFKSLEQILQKNINRKKRPRQELNVRLPKITSCQAKETSKFTGYMFKVLDGTYKLERNSLDEEQAKSEGWSEIASQVKHQQDVVNFILQHGGQVVPNICDSNYVIGGHSDDPRGMLLC